MFLPKAADLGSFAGQAHDAKTARPRRSFAVPYRFDNPLSVFAARPKGRIGWHRKTKGVCYQHVTCFMDGDAFQFVVIERRRELLRRLADGLAVLQTLTTSADN